MKKILFLSLIFFGACGTYNYKDLILPEGIAPDYKSPEKLSQKEVEDDTALLKYILRKAYAGRFVISKRIMTKAIRELGEIKGEMSTKEFCERAGKALASIPDYHLHIRHNGEVCSRSKEISNFDIGKNIAKEKGKTWVVEKRKFKNREYLLISISSFPSHQSAKWNGFLDTIQKYHNPEIPVILDLRNNGGGDDTFGYRLSGFFHKSEGDFDFPNPYEKQITSQTLETQVLKVNVGKYWLRGKVTDKKPLEIYLAEQELELERILKNGYPEQKISYNEKIPSNWIFKGYQNQIFILIDGNCYSSCESTVDTFEYNPYVKKVGRPTGGMVHFGNVSPAFLKHSKLYVQVPTHANLYRDGRFIEKIGITPDILIPNQTDALNFVLENLLLENLPSNKKVSR